MFLFCTTRRHNLQHFIQIWRIFFCYFAKEAQILRFRDKDFLIFLSKPSNSRSRCSSRRHLQTACSLCRLWWSGAEAAEPLLPSGAECHGKILDNNCQTLQKSPPDVPPQCATFAVHAPSGRCARWCNRSPARLLWSPWAASAGHASTPANLYLRTRG